MTSVPLHSMILILISMNIFANPAPYLITTSSGMALSWRVCGPTPSTSIARMFLYALLVQHLVGVGQQEGALVGQDRALVTGMSTPGAGGSARRGTRESASATWTPMPAVRSSGLPLVQDIIHLRLVSY